MPLKSTTFDADLTASISRCSRLAALLALALVSSLTAACSRTEPGGEPPSAHPGVEATPELVSHLDEDNLQAWREAIWPRASELSWEQIDWLPTFEEGVRGADAAGRPVLMWAMNGHPLGCT